MTDPYAQLAALAARELELASAGQADELAAVQARRAALVAALPAAPPASARAALERAARAQHATTAALRAGADRLAADLERIRCGRTQVRGYAGAPAAPADLDLSA